MIKKKQKILIACDSSKSLIDFRGKLIEEMVKHHQVYVFTPRTTQQDVLKKLAALKVVVYENELNGSNVSIRSDLKYIIQLYKLVKKVRPDIFFPYTFKPVIYGTLITKICGVSKLTPMLTGLGYSFSSKQPDNIIGRITKWLLKLSLLENSRMSVVFQNKDDYQTLLKHKILSATQKAFVVNGSGVDMDHYVYTRPDIKNVSFIMISRLINAKGIYEYFEAAKKILSKYPEVKFKLIGSYDKNIDAISPDLFSKIKFGSTIEYIGEVSDVRPYISDASVVVLPSYYGEGIPRCLLESMAMGRPIITSDSVGCRETVESSPDINGFLIPVKNIPALVSKMEFYLNNREAILSNGLNSLEVARRKFDVNLVNADMLRIMQLN